MSAGHDRRSSAAAAATAAASSGGGGGLVTNSAQRHQQRRRRRRQQQQQVLLLAAAAALFSCLEQLPRAAAFPSLFVARAANGCTDHPAASFGKVHDYTSAPDRTVAFALTSKATGRAVAAAANGGGAARVCAGDDYALRLDFGAPSTRNFLLTSTLGSLTVAKNDCDAWCPNRVCSPAPTTGATVAFKLPCGTAPGTGVTLKVTSANGRTPTPGSTLRSATLSLVVDGACPGKCGGSSSSVTVERGKAPSG